MLFFLSSRAIFFGIDLEIERIHRAENPMSFAERFDLPEPECSEHAGRLGMTDRALCHLQFGLQDLGGEGGDDPPGMILRHAPSMTNFLDLVNPTDTASRQIPWRGIIRAMEKSDRPFADIAERIRWHRALEGVDQKTYAAKAGLNRNQLSNWESGDYRISLDGARALRKTYGLSLDFIIEGNDEALSMTLRKAWRERP